MVLLFAASVWAQGNYPDKITLYNESVFECRITSVDSKKITMVYGKNISETVIVAAIKKIELEKFGLIYEIENGFIGDEDKIEEFIHKRNDKTERERLATRELEKLERKKNSDTIEVKEEMAEIEEVDEEEPEETAEANYEVEDGNSYKKWNFSAVLVPYYSGETHTISYYSNYPNNYQSYYAYSLSRSEINMIWLLSYSLKQNIQVTFDFAYNSSYDENDSEYHNRGTGYSEDRGELNITGLSLFNFNLGIKYYLFEKKSSGVNIFFQPGFGKQIANSDEEYKNHFPTSTTISEDNMKEYLEEINSPWLINFGFGAEYYFNESLSLISMVRFVYSASSGTYKTRYISTSQTVTTELRVKQSSVINRIGLGVNFYF